MKHNLSLLACLMVVFSYAQEKKTYCSLKEAMESPEDVYILNLSKSNLAEVPLKVFLFRNLKSLDLSFNRLHHIPPDIALLQNLEKLDLSFNSLVDLPPEIGNLPNLRELNLSFNRITFLPPGIGNLKKLKALNVSFNQIAFLPPEIEDLEALRFFSPKMNPIKGFKELKALKKRNPLCKILGDTIEISGFPEFPDDVSWQGNKKQQVVVHELSDTLVVDDHEPGKKTKTPGKNSHTGKPVEGKGNYAYDYKTKDKQDKDAHLKSFDFSFFTTDEMKRLYRDAFNRKDYDQIALLQEELAKRSKNPPPEDSSAVNFRGSGDPMKGVKIPSSKNILQAGNYFSLVIGINNYRGFWSPLKNALNDAKAVEKLLRENYRIDYIHTLYNEEATRQNIVKEMEWLVKNVKENDNVFIYYSGHGEYKQELNRGYWVPVDATDPSTYNLIPNSDLQTFLGGIKSKHTLLATDACFSGDIFRGNTYSIPFEQNEKYYGKVYELTSRQALTAGSIEPVVDSGSEGHSVFTYYLLKSLQNNERPLFDAGQLFEEIKIPVMNNSDQTPLLKPVKDTGDEGGQFIFMRK